MNGIWRSLCCGWVLALAGCASAPAPLKPKLVIAIQDSSKAADQDEVDVRRVIDGVHMIMAGQIQAAIDGPFDEVVDRHEKKYAGSKEKIYSARNGTDALLYAATAATAKPPMSATILGPAWAMAYWGRGYACNEMAAMTTPSSSCARHSRWRPTIPSTTSNSPTPFNRRSSGRLRSGFSGPRRTMRRSRCRSRK